jgi:predicted nuclease of predicted toxin-antitoxin system
VRLLFDYNLSYRLVAALADLYPDSSHVRALGLESADDAVIWTYARQHSLAIVSKDSDFFHLSVLFGHPPKVIWIRLGNCTTDTVEALLRTRHPDVLAFEQDAAASFLALGMTQGSNGHT